MSGGADGAVTRRGFVAAGVVCAATVALGGAGLAARQAHAVELRPPGSDGEVDLAARCNRCQKCVQACPYGIIQPLPLSLSVMNVGTPALSFKTGYCDFCMKCVEACPTGALRAGTSTYDDIGVAKVVSDACVAWHWAGCTVCVDECPVEGATSLDDLGRPTVDERLCDGCRRCEQMCPASSLRSYDASVAAKGIYVVPRSSAAARRAGALTTAELGELRGVEAGEEALHA